MSLTRTNIQAPAETTNRSTTSTENEISVLSSRPFRRVQVIAITVIVSGIILLSVVAITASLVISTRGSPEKQQEGPQDISTSTATPTRTVTVTATATATVTTPSTPIPATTANAITTATAKATSTTLAAVYSWSEWSSWLPHNVTCGYQRRMRKCRLSHSKHHGTYCSGPMVHTRNLTLCRDCKEWCQSGGSNTSGVYTIRPDSLHPFKVYCDMTTDGGGWTVFQRRQDGSEDFFRNWTEYKTGFGNLSGEFWLGNDKIHRLTAANESSLHVDLEDWNGNTKYAQYRRFSVASIRLNYRLSVEGYSGTAGDSLIRVHNGMAFSTKDKDNDDHSINCALSKRGAWWFSDCHDSNLNGMYVEGSINDETALTWYQFNRSFVALKFSEMKLRAI